MNGNNHLTSRIPKFRGTRQIPYAVLTVAATSVVGVWMAAKNNSDHNENDEKIDSSASSRYQNLNERHSSNTSAESISSGADRGASTESLYQTVENNLSRSSLNTINSTMASCLCERRTQQIPNNNNNSNFDFDSVPLPNNGRPKSVLTQDKSTALVRKHRTLRLLDKYKTQTSVDSKYSWNKDEMVGEGAYSKVYQATSKDTNEVVALKNISKKYTDSQYFQQEVEAMLYIQERGGHPHVITLHEHFEDGDSFILILDFIRGGELFDHLIEMGAYSEMDASRIVREVASALLYLHGIGLVHADLKPEVGN